MLTIAKRAPEWRDYAGAELCFAPITMPMVRRAQAAVRGVSAEGIEESDDQLLAMMIRGDALSRALLIEGIIDWRGVADENDDPLPCDTANKALLIDDPQHFQALDTLYVVPFIERQREKNASPPSPAGIGAGAMQDSDTATSPATPGKASGATNAPTGRKPRKATKG